MYLSGQMCIDQTSGKLVEQRDIVAQVQKICENIGMVLRAAELTFGHLVKTVDFIALSALEGYRAKREVRLDFFEDNFPPSTGVIANKMPHPHALIQITVLVNAI